MKKYFKLIIIAFICGYLSLVALENLAILAHNTIGLPPMQTQKYGDYTLVSLALARPMEVDTVLLKLNDKTIILFEGNAKGDLNRAILLDQNEKSLASVDYSDYPKLSVLTRLGEHGLIKFKYPGMATHLYKDDQKRIQYDDWDFDGHFDFLFINDYKLNKNTQYIYYGGVWVAVDEILHGVATDNSKKMKWKFDVKAGRWVIDE